MLNIVSALCASSVSFSPVLVKYRSVVTFTVFFKILAEFYDKGQCHSCHSTCSSCTGPTENDCLSCAASLYLQETKCVSVCEDGYFLDSKICSKCLHTCSLCNSRNNCTKCVKGLVLQSGTCRGTCEDG